MTSAVVSVRRHGEGRERTNSPMMSMPLLKLAIGAAPTIRANIRKKTGAIMQHKPGDV